MKSHLILWVSGILGSFCSPPTQYFVQYWRPESQCQPPHPPPFQSFHLFILRSSLTLTCPSASAELGLGGGELESLRQAPFRVSRLGTAPVMSSSSSPFPFETRHKVIYQKGLTTLALLCWLRFILLTPASRLNLASKDAASPTRDLCSSRWGSPWKPRGLRELDLVLSTGSWADCIGFVEIVCGRQMSTCSMA